MTETADRPIDKGLRVSAWALYGLIVFEILFMVSPFVIFQNHDPTFFINMPPGSKAYPIINTTTSSDL